MSIILNIILFIVSLPDNIRSGIIVFCYLSAYLLSVMLVSCGDDYE